MVLKWYFCSSFILPIMSYLKFPKYTSAGWYRLEALVYLVVSEWKKTTWLGILKILVSMQLWLDSNSVPILELKNWGLEKQLAEVILFQWWSLQEGNKGLAFIVWPPRIILKICSSTVLSNSCSSLDFCLFLPLEQHRSRCSLVIGKGLAVNWQRHSFQSSVFWGVGIL